MLEIINRNSSRGKFKFALFDFDGTISLIREGWQKVMKSYFYEEMRKTPDGKTEEEDSLRNCIDEFVDINTGKQTIYQCFALVDEMKKRGGKPEEALFYKDEYQRRLLEQIDHRIYGLEHKLIAPETLVVPGSFEFLDMLREQGITLFLASGTDEAFARHEAEILGVTKYFGDHVYGAQRDYRSFSKKMVIERILHENNLQGEELLGVGDGFVEIENVKEAGGFALGVASDEKNRSGQPDAWKRERLTRAGADAVIPDYSNLNELKIYLMGKE